jgi:hypothetical protein
MLKNISRARVVGLWLAAVAVLTAALVTFDPHAAIDLAPLLLTLALGPPAVTLLVWRGAPPPTVAELLHSVNADKRGRS